MANADEKLLLKALRSGDESEINRAFEKIYYDYVKLIAFVVGKFVRDGEAVKELVNETFFRLFSHADGVKNIKYYLVTTAKNLSIDYVRRERPTEALTEQLADRTQHSADYDAVVARLRGVLREDETEIVLLHAVEGYTFREIAAMTGKNRNTVLTTYYRALKRYQKEETFE